MADATLRDSFLDLFNLMAQGKIAGLAHDWQEKTMSGDSEGAAKAAADRATLQGIAAQVTTDDRAALVALWPAAILGDIPAWFSDPVAAATADPPGAAHIVDLEVPPIPESIEKDADGNPVVKKSPIQVAIETRASRKEADDAAREAWLADQAAKRNASQLRLNLVNEKRTAKGWAALDMAYWESIGEDQDVALRFA